MIKLTHLIVDTNYRLIGFVAEGKAREFGELGNSKICRPVTLKYLFDTNFNNKQISMSRGTIIEKAGFKLNDLHMLMLQGGEYKDIDNTITLTKRYVKDNENIGFDVTLGTGNTGKFTYENVLRLCSIFNPTNFVIRIGKDNKKFIAGKAGYPLSDLPVEEMGGHIEAKRTRPAAKKVGNITGDFANDVDILDLYDFIREAKGFIINLPGTKYTATTESAAAAKEFVPFDIGEVGTPYLDFNENKMNVSCNFKKPGAVAIELHPGKRTNIITFVYRRKNIFFNGENYINKLGVVIPISAEPQLIDKFGRSMSFTEITDAGMIRTISMLIAQQNIKIYEVDTSKIGIIARGKYDSMIIPTKDVFERVSALAKNKLILKYLNGLIKESKKTGVYDSLGIVHDIAPQFAAMSAEELATLGESGIDIYSGAFTAKDESRKTGGVSDDSGVEIGYTIEGLSTLSLTYAQIAASDKKCPDFLLNLVAKFNSIKDPIDKAEKANQMVQVLTQENDQLKRLLWLHKCAMYLKSNKTSVHSHDKDCWEINTKKRTKATCYNCTLKGCEKLQLLVNNIGIK